uniref:Integrin subunit alpha X n=1 Tax=Canis lupus familiaris TaxID=9615 RepID=A0A8P0PL57_CANLF
MTRTRTSLLLLMALASSLCFNLDTEQPKSFLMESAGFGHSVVQYDNSWVVVGAPQEIKAANQTGGLYQCDYSTGKCEPIQLQVPLEAVNMSLGLSLAASTKPSQLLVTQRLPAALQGAYTLVTGVQWARNTLSRMDKKRAIWRKIFTGWDSGSKYALGSHLLISQLALLPSHFPMTLPSQSLSFLICQMRTMTHSALRMTDDYPRPRFSTVPGMW